MKTKRRPQRRRPKRPTDAADRLLEQRRGDWFERAAVRKEQGT